MEENRQMIQTRYIELQMIQQQLEQLEQQFEKIEEQNQELDKMLDSLEDLKNAKEGSEMLVPFSSGIFARGTLKDPKKLLVNVGANVVVEKDIGGTKELLENQRIEILKFQQEVVTQMENLTLKATELQEELKNLAG